MLWALMKVTFGLFPFLHASRGRKKKLEGIFVLEDPKNRSFEFLAAYDNIALKGCCGWRSLMQI